jgi:hypothetical protein
MKNHRNIPEEAFFLVTIRLQKYVACITDDHVWYYLFQNHPGDRNANCPRSNFVDPFGNSGSSGKRVGDFGALQADFTR